MTDTIRQIFDKIDRTRKGAMLATAEFCTGGMIAAAITDRAGSSAYFDRGFVTYSNEAKQDMLRVSAQTLAVFGAVSAECAREMAEGALGNSRASIAVSVTGIAGPGGGSAGKPVGLVYFGLAAKGRETVTDRKVFSGDRDAVRRQTRDHALHLILNAI